MITGVITQHSHSSGVRAGNLGDTILEFCQPQKDRAIRDVSFFIREGRLSKDTPARFPWGPTGQDWVTCPSWLQRKLANRPLVLSASITDLKGLVRKEEDGGRRWLLGGSNLFGHTCSDQGFSIPLCPTHFLHFVMKY